MTMRDMETSNNKEELTESRAKARIKELEEINGRLVQEVNRLKLAEENLRKNENRFRIMADFATDAIFLISKNGMIIDANHHACTSLKYDRDELIGMDIKQIDCREDNKGLPKEEYQRLRKGKTFVFEAKHRCKDGSVFPVEVRICRIQPPDGVPLLLAVSRDISLRKHDEEERKKLEAQLAYTQKMQSLGTLAGGIAHNFNNLLMGIQGYTSLMLLEKSKDDTEYVKLDNIQKLVENGAKLTNQLLEYAREKGYEIKPINLNKIVKETAETFGGTRKDIRIDLKLSDELHGIKADQGQIEQTLFNLYVNAADAMPRGGSLSISTANITHKDMGNRDYRPKHGNYVRLMIKDTGTGMSDEIKRRVFEPFFTTKGLARGTGLGLASAYGIVKSHGGYIDVDSSEGIGTLFQISLPSTNERIRDEKIFPNEILAGSETILLVDDESIVIDVASQMLKNLGYSVLTAMSGIEAVDLYKKKYGEIDMVLLDIIMPDMGGDEAYKMMKDINPEIKALLSSGYSIDERVNEILQMGCDGFIQKPFNLKRLSHKIREVLEE